MFFISPRLKIRGHIVLFSHLSKTFKLLITFDSECLDIPHEYFLRQNLFVNTNMFYPVALEFGLHKKINRAFVNHEHILLVISV